MGWKWRVLAAAFVVLSLAVLTPRFGEQCLPHLLMTAGPPMHAPRLVEPTIHIYNALVLKEWGHWEDTPVSITKPAAIALVLTRIDMEEKRLLASLALFMPDAATYVACTTPLITQFVEATFSKPELRLVPGMDEFLKHKSKEEMWGADTWAAFNGRRVDILRLILLEGHDGAWYLDGDAFLLAPLPLISAEIQVAPCIAKVGMRKQPFTGKRVKKYGTWNSGILFWRSLRVLKTWDTASKELEQKGRKQLHQQTLDVVVERHSEELLEFGRGVNVCKWLMFELEDRAAPPEYHLVRCQGGEVQFKNCTIIAGRWHPVDTEIRPHMEKALLECQHPFLEAWRLYNVGKQT